MADIDIPWAELRDAATAARARAYCPYSHYPVGAAGLVEDGRLVAGCNVENASYGLTLCAECGLISQLRLSGGGRLRAVVCMDGAGAAITPCGRCRQLLLEHSLSGMYVLTDRGPVPIEDLLPAAWGASELHADAEADPAVDGGETR
jgi:cytidine deaminase